MYVKIIHFFIQLAGWTGVDLEVVLVVGLQWT